jgi:two-component system, NtrC family, nitrogen regulation sensor histidine kinase NtrY
LVTSTKNKIFSSGLISKQINAEAFEKMRVQSQSFYIHDEKIGSLKYISAYVPVLDTKHNVIAYLNLPFFTNEAELSDEISAFFVNFVNLYILFFLVAAVIAYIITQRVTAPLTLIQNKLSKLSLSSKNEIIEWKDEDEIGELVAQYNKMIIALEESANRLAEGEREGAWREMAKQIAHEIKNPLTPMKLSVQHLQRAWAAKGENIDEIFKRVTSVLIEQIDSLSNLASEFSSFAKMPEPVAEKLELNDLLRLTAALYENTQNIHVAFEPYTTTAFVMADKDQLSRVFKNLITNAIQAIPDETEGVIEIKILKTETYYKVEVSDNGKGIPDEQGNKVFIPSFSTKTSGMGLGLAISKKIVESVGGKIYFVSQVNVGTTFVVELPVVVGD